MNRDLVSIINDQSKQLFKNTEYVLDYIDGKLLTENICKWPLWRQLYHMLHSMDQWFLNPFRYQDEREDGHEIAALNTEIERAPLSKTELRDYYRQTKDKITAYLGDLKETALTECPEGSRFTRLDLILGQFRHIMFHIGMIHGCILMRNGEIPDYVGLSEPVRPVE